MIKTLIVGVIFTTCVFALKSGMGLGYLLKMRKKREALFVLLVYFFTFFLTYLIVRYVDFVKHFSIFESFLKKGMIVHFILAVGMFLWGIDILLNERKESKSYLFLTLPCPFCVIVIILTLGFVYKFYGNYSIKYALMVYLIFTVFQIASAVAVKFFKISPQNFLGLALIGVGLYFLITFTVAPVFSDIDRIFRISFYSLSSTQEFYKKNVAFFIVLGLIALSGFLRYRFKR